MVRCNMLTRCVAGIGASAAIVLGLGSPAWANAADAPVAGVPSAQDAAAPPAPAAATQPAAPAQPAGPPSLADLAWLSGCWSGAANQREFTEQWTRAAGGMMLGLGHTVMAGSTLEYEFLRIATLPDGRIVYLTQLTDKPEDGFVYQGVRDDHGETSFVFANAQRDFPAEIAYTHTKADELFAFVRGKINGESREVIYPFHRADCPSGKAP
jgi:Domain of unknown function (DUF6265)